MRNASRRSLLSFLGATTLFGSMPSFAKLTASDPIMILIELQGANDSLNTFVPYTNDYYYRLRPQIHIPKSSVLHLNDNLGFHPALTEVAKLYERGECAVIQGLGYPQPVLSHFKSIELWERGGDGRRSGGLNGWLVQPINQLAAAIDYDAKAIFLDQEGGIFEGGGGGYLGPDSLGYKPVQFESRDATVPISIGSEKIGLLGELIEMRGEADRYLEMVQKKIQGRKREIYGFGNDGLSQQLSKICNVISYGVRVPVFKVSLGSFDTHDNQLPNHNSLLSMLDSGISQTVAALKEMGLWRNSVIMTYSEFGRRVKENGSAGTDHGMAAAHFLLGGNISGGFVGSQPNLSSLDDNNLQFSLDYRALYDSILRGHFGVQKNLFEKYKSDELAGLFS